MPDIKNPTADSPVDVGKVHWLAQTRTCIVANMRLIGRNHDD